MSRVIGIVEDDRDQLENYADALVARGYAVAGFTLPDEAFASFSLSPPDLVILDIILGDQIDGGFDLCRKLLQRHPALPVIFLTDRVDEVDRISGLRLGAWDYETKPISLPLLAEKIAALLRVRDLRAQDDRPATTAVTTGALALDDERMEARWKGDLLDLTLAEFRILATLARRPGRVFSYDELMDAALGSVVTRNTVNTHVRNLRRKFGDIDEAFGQIENEYGLGYRWREE